MSYIPTILRHEVLQRAGHCCEYCLLNQADEDLSFHVEHIIPLRLNGETISLNLCLSCPACNLAKGTNIAAADSETGQATFLFNPRQQVWDEHFRLLGAYIEPLTAIGRVSVFVLRLNQERRLERRETLIKMNRYPCKLNTI